MTRAKKLKLSPVTEEGVRRPAPEGFNNVWRDSGEKHFCSTAYAERVTSSVRNARS
jgi:hypothetical protein